METQTFCLWEIGSLGVLYKVLDSIYLVLYEIVTRLNILKAKRPISKKKDKINGRKYSWRR